MFKPEGLGEVIFNERYAHPGETWEMACWRVANHVARAEDDGQLKTVVSRNQFDWTMKFAEELVENRFNPGGRIWYGAGRPKAQLLNCFVLPTSDSREGWGKTVSDVIVVSGTGGGIGINCSSIRPRGSDILGTGGKATGSVSLMQLINKVSDVVVGGGSRRSALMLCLDIDHPDIEEFLNAKLDLDQLNYANISCVLPWDVSKFQEAVRKDQGIPLRFGDNSSRSISSGLLWSRLVENAWKSGEPGVLNAWEANQKNNIWYRSHLYATNPCGEQWLESYGSCCLGALVLPRFVRDNRMDWDLLASSINTAVRFLDNVLTVNHFPIPEIRDNSLDVRRIGLGVMGLHSMLLELGYKYSSPEGQKFIDTLFDFFKTQAYGASIELAKEKGSFSAYDQRFLQSGFVKTLDESTRRRIEQDGIRNCALLTVAPTGTTSMVSGVSSGIEPLFAPAYYRNYRQIDESARESKARELIITPEFEKFGDLAEGAYDLSPQQHFEVQRIVQQHVDNAVSKTINLPNDYPVDKLADNWLEYLPYIKGSTIYRSGSRGNEPLEPILYGNLKALRTDARYEVEDNWEELNSLECPGGVCDIRSHGITAS